MQPAVTDGLCNRLADDADDAFAELVNDHQDLVYGVALRVVGNATRAEDVAQEAFVRAYRALKTYSRDRIRELRLRPWLARITVNVARNSLRAQRSLDGLDADAAELAARDDGPARVAERRDEQRMWARLLAALPDHYRLAVALRHVEGLSYVELAETLGRPVGTIKSDVHRGTALLRAAYDAEQRALAPEEAAS